MKYEQLKMQKVPKNGKTERKFKVELPEEQWELSLDLESRLNEYHLRSQEHSKATKQREKLLQNYQNAGYFQRRKIMKEIQQQTETIKKYSDSKTELDFLKQVYKALGQE